MKTKTKIKKNKNNNNSITKNGKLSFHPKNKSNSLWSILHIVMPKNAQEKNYKDLNSSIKSKIKIKNLKVLFYPLLEKNKLP